MSVKLNKQRRDILELIHNSDGHKTADQIHSDLKDQGKAMGIATIYRNLNYLYDKELINRVQHPDLGYIYDKNVHRHYHFLCVLCNKIEDVEIDITEDINKKIEDILGVKVIDHELTFDGYCSECRKKMK